MIEGRWLPAGAQGVALLAIRREVRSHMVGIGCSLIVLPVAGIAVGLCIPVVGAGMAIGTFEVRVALHEREESVVKSRAGPLKRIDRMTNSTILREARLNMVGVIRGQEFSPVAVDAVHSQDIEAKRVFRFVALIAIGCPVSPEQWETAHPVDPCNITHEP